MVGSKCNLPDLGMKKLLILCAALLALAGCKKTPAVHPEWTYGSVMYEVNIRQFSPEGTFAGVEAQLPRLKDLGVDILWLMPMYEIGTEGRKGTLGSYYAISDYKKVNPEFGTMEDFEHLVAEAHKLGFKVILDWVANQTAPDNVWMYEKPANFYERDSLGNAIWEYDWTDTRSLNYDNEEVWWAQDDAMRFWLEKGVDGFRCDAAGEVPAEFWKGILPKMTFVKISVFTTVTDILPFKHTVGIASGVFYGSYGCIYPHVLWVLGYAAVIFAVTLLVNRVKK